MEGPLVRKEGGGCQWFLIRDLFLSPPKQSKHSSKATLMSILILTLPIGY